MSENCFKKVKQFIKFLRSHAKLSLKQCLNACKVFLTLGEAVDGGEVVPSVVVTEVGGADGGAAAYNVAAAGIGGGDVGVTADN